MQTTLTTNNSIVHIKLVGKFDMAARPEFNKALGEAQSKNPPEIIIDLREVPLIDSSAIGMLMVAQKKLASKSIRLTLCCGEGQVKNILNLAQVERIIPIVSSI